MPSRCCGTPPDTTDSPRAGEAELRLAPRGAAPVVEDLAGRQAARGTHHAAARVGPRAALVVAGDRGAVLGPARRGTEEEHLGRQELSGEDVPLRQADGPLDVEWRDHLAVEDQVAEPWKE